ncbi:hypothetical protein UFOVP248_40 [uncultured Caudovirales phage]|uniref:Uncharacterized protein n=1 Tax=uncultured Caudovirales phage TaxID=2100421 RepID=A0A6J5LH43_9CAUD|nr:hypothetical protein UFOVP248_40 [uncultured Caudovirales phage]
MNITLLSVDIKTVPTAKGSYQTADVAYKNNSFQGKVEGKKVMSFGATKDSFSTLALAQPGESYEVTIVKNDKGYNDWVSMAKAEAGASSPAVSAPAGGKAPAATPRSTYETPEERAQRQVLIVRQSSLSAAVNLLLAGAKTPPPVENVLAIAKQFEDYVFGKQALGPISEMSDDFPQVD